MITLILLIGFFQLSDPYRIAGTDPGRLGLKGDSLYWAKDYIARANYQIGRYDQADQMAFSIPEDSITHEFLYFDLLTLKALTSKAQGRFGQADSLYDVFFSKIPEGYEPLKYRAHLNRAELRRLQMDYRGREVDLLNAITHANKGERDRVRRVLARHYFKVEGNFRRAEMILNTHTPYDSLKGDDKAGYELLLAEMAEAQAEYQRAKDFYFKASQTARQAGYSGIVYDAAEGYMRVVRQRFQIDKKRAANIIILLVAVLITAYITRKYG